MGNDFSPKTIWNFDEARMKELHLHMVWCEQAFERWDINEINNELYTLRRIISGAINETNWKDLIEDYKKLEENKRKLHESKTDEEHHLNIIKFYNQADKILLKLNRFLKKKGMCFREGEDIRFAALKR